MWFIMKTESEHGKRIIRVLETDENGDPISRFRTEIYTEKGQPINYVIQLEVKTKRLLKKEWKPVIRYNYSHEISHRDIYNLKGDKIKENLGFFKDLKHAIDYGIKDIKSNWEIYIEKFKSDKKWKP